MKKYLFPFFGEQHKFLLSRWWFRLMLIVYGVGLR